MDPNPLTVQMDVGGAWHLGIFAVCAAVLVGLLFPKWRLAGQLIPWQAKALWVYVALCCVFVIEYPRIHYGAYNTAFMWTCAQTLVEATLIPLGAILFTRRALGLLPWAVAFTCACVWLRWDGLFISPTLGMSFCAAALPFVPWWLGLPIIVTAITHRGSTALLIIAAQLFALALKRKYRLHWLLPLAVAGLYAVARHHNAHDPSFDSAERIVHYRQAMRFWIMDWRQIVFGVGPGSFMWVSLILNRFKGMLFLQLHSDVLQVLFELGVIGFGLCGLLILRAIKGAFSDPNLLAGLFGVIAFCAPYHPTRFGPSAALVALVFWLSISRRRKSALHRLERQRRG